MYKAKLTFPPDLIPAIRDLNRKALAQYRIELRTVVKPAVEKEVKKFLAKEPGPAVHPFVFATARSRRAFFATQGFGRGIPTKRSHAIADSWDVQISGVLDDNVITVLNLRPEAQYVYPGPAQTPGHANTGWGATMDADLDHIEQVAIDESIDAWYRAGHAALRK